jgi:hypothetical protein
MAKHPHKLILLDKKTWRCVLEGCNFFVHRGLEHVLIGKVLICWNCNEQFTADPMSLKDEMPTCNGCKAGERGTTLQEREDYINAKLELAKAGVKSVKDLDPDKRRLLEAAKGVKFSVLEDQIEVIEADEVHAPDCSVYEGGDCTCK